MPAGGLSWLGMDEACIQVITGLCTVYGGLPQGAPTSPLLANMVFRKVDYRLKNFAKSRKLSYTRYADDLTFSGMFQKEQVIGVVSGILRDNGFTVQCRKTHVMQKNERQKVTGVIVNEKVRAPKELRKKLRQAAYYIGKYGVENYLSHEGKDPQYLDVLKGQCAFVLQTCDELPIRELIELLK